MTTTANSQKSDVIMHGPLSLIARARWAPSSDAIQTPIDSPGVKDITRASAGVYSVNLLPGFKAVTAMVQRIDDGITLYQWHDVTAVTTTAVSIRQRSKAFASVAGAPDASDTCDQIEVLVWGRVAS
jgi:hypothetical protein